MAFSGFRHPVKRLSHLKCDLSHLDSVQPVHHLGADCKDWMKTKGDTGKRKTFVNTTSVRRGRRKLANVRMLK